MGGGIPKYVYIYIYVMSPGVGKRNGVNKVQMEIFSKTNHDFSSAPHFLRSRFLVGIGHVRNHFELPAPVDYASESRR